MLLTEDALLCGYLGDERTLTYYQETLAQEYGQQFMNAMRSVVGVTRNEKAIAATKARITGGGS